jgi:Skp family chaperone for outer membrane proteins
MKFQRILVLFLFIAAAGTVAMAQVPAQTTPTRIAVIDTEAFADPKTGVKKLITAYQTLDTEFKARRDEITGLRTRYEALAREVSSPAAGTTQQALATKADQARTLELDIKRKQEDGAAAYSRRVVELTGPITLTLNNALAAFAKARGVDILVDLAKNRDSMLILNNTVNITQVFIADYNAKNP